MLKARVFESPFMPVPDCGVSVFTKATPGLAIIAAGTVTLIVVVSTHVGAASLFPFHCTTVPLGFAVFGQTKPFAGLAFTVKVKSAPPAESPLGERFVSVAPVLY